MCYSPPMSGDVPYESCATTQPTCFAESRRRTSTRDGRPSTGRRTRSAAGARRVGTAAARAQRLGPGRRGAARRTCRSTAGYRRRAVRGLLDTSVFIADEDGRPLASDKLPDQAAISVITLAELELGVHMAASEAVRGVRLRTLQATQSTYVALPVDAAIASALAELVAIARRAGRRPKVKTPGLRPRHAPSASPSIPRTGNSTTCRWSRPRLSRAARFTQTRAIDAAAEPSLNQPQFADVRRVTTSHGLNRLARNRAEPPTRYRLRRPR